MHCREESEGVLERPGEGVRTPVPPPLHPRCAPPPPSPVRYTLARGWSIIPSVPCFAIETGARGVAFTFLARKTEGVGHHPPMYPTAFSSGDAINVIISSECFAGPRNASRESRLIDQAAAPAERIVILGGCLRGFPFSFLHPLPCPSSPTPRPPSLSLPPGDDDSVRAATKR